MRRRRFQGVYDVTHEAALSRLERFWVDQILYKL